MRLFDFKVPGHVYSILRYTGRVTERENCYSVASTVVQIYYNAETCIKNLRNRFPIDYNEYRLALNSFAGGEKKIKHRQLIIMMIAQKTIVRPAFS